LAIGKSQLAAAKTWTDPGDEELITGDEALIPGDETSIPGDEWG
jgi:hypothetical protein